MLHKDRADQQLNAVLYARVSSKQQEEEGYSIPAQLELLRSYANQNGMVILREFVETESAKVSGRAAFNEMVKFLRNSHSSRPVILVEKTDRLHRNLKDYVTLDELGVTIHFVKEGSILSPDAKSSDHLIHGIKVLMARNYSQNLGEETLKGMLQKAKSGIYPSFAPAGYRNAEGQDNRRVIVPNDDAPMVSWLFDQFATGQYSLKSLAAHARKEQRTIRGRSLHTSTLHQILRKRIYSGDFDWDGVTYKGTHQPLISRETWEKVQALLGHRAEKKHHLFKHDFAFTGFVNCGHCGCSMVGEIKKRKYVYYHCTGHRGKCAEPYTREEVLQGQFAELLRELVIPTGVLAWLQVAIAASELDQQKTQEREIKRLEDQHHRIQSRLDAMYEDKLEGRITAETYDRKAAEERRRSLELLRQINELRKNQPAPVQRALDLMDLTSRAADLFSIQPAHEKKRFLRLLLHSASWQQGRLQVKFENPFESLRRSNQLSRSKYGDNVPPKTESEIWLLR